MKPLTELPERLVGADAVRMAEIERTVREAAVELHVAGAIERGAVQKPEELAALLRMLQESPPRTVVEIGTDTGGSIYAFAQVADPEATIVSIDKPFGEFGTSVKERVPEAVESYVKETQTLHCLAKDSQRRSTRRHLKKVLEGRPIDFLMIDGDHRYTGVRRDWELYSPLVAKGGIIVLHDILPHESATNCEVARLWAELAPNHDSLEIIHEPEQDQGWGPWAGIGVIIK